MAASSGKIDCFLRLNGQESGFRIEPQCKLAKLKANLLEQLGLKITALVHVSRPSQTRKAVDLDDDEKYLIEDIGVRARDCLEVTTKVVQEGKGIADGVSLWITLEYKVSKEALVPAPASVRVPVQARKGSPIQHMVDLLQKNCDFVPGTVQLLLDGNVLNTARTVESYPLGPTSKLTARGEWFPISIFGGAVRHLENVGVHRAPECCICLTELPCRTFDCGHMNVCKTCSWSSSLCPVCQPQSS